MEYHSRQKLSKDVQVLIPTTHEYVVIWQGEWIKIADGIKVANHLTLK